MRDSALGFCVRNQNDLGIYNQKRFLALQIEKTDETDEIDEKYGNFDEIV